MSTESLAEHRSSSTSAGRVNQKKRTRAAIVAAAADLLAGGVDPSMEQVAEMAGVSRTTLYRYFPSMEGLVAEALFDEAFPLVEVPRTGDPIADVAAVERTVNEGMFDNQQLVRIMMREAYLRGAGDAGPPRRGRRLRYIDEALEGAGLEPDALARLRAALALVMGPEAMITLCDVAGLDEEESSTVTAWAAEALVRAATGSSQAGP